MYLKIILGLVLFGIFIPERSDARIIITVAGTGTAGYIADGITATNAQLYNPFSVSTDSAGNIYISDMWNYRIRKIAVGTGVISTVAGTGTAGYNTDGIDATTALLNFQMGIAVDSGRNIFIADLINNRIRKVDAATGFISTVAGKLGGGFNADGIDATTANLYYPAGVCLDSSGNIFIADMRNNRIRKVDVGTGLISTVAGVGPTYPSAGGYDVDGVLATAAKLNNPYGVFVDASGNIFIADTENHRIRKVTSSTGKISTVAGTGTGGYNGDGIPATSSQVYSPSGVFVDSSGNIFIADTWNERVRKVDVVTGLISTVAGTGTGGYNGDGIDAMTAQLNRPGNIYVDSTGNIFIADFANHRIRKVLVDPPVEPPKARLGSLYVYPHPMKCPGGTAVFEMEEQGTVTLRIMNMRGHLVKEITRTLNANPTAKVFIDCNDYDTGIYLIKGEIVYTGGPRLSLETFKLGIVGKR